MPVFNTREQLDLGAVPSDETCVQAPYSDKSRQKAQGECERFRQQLKARFPNPPASVAFCLKRHAYQPFFYYSVVIEFNPLIDTAVDFAFFVEHNLPRQWDEQNVLSRDE